MVQIKSSQCFFFFFFLCTEFKDSYHNSAWLKVYIILKFANGGDCNFRVIVAQKTITPAR